MRLPAPIPVFAISLERSLDRRSRMQDQFAHFDCFEWSFVDAVDGRRIPKAAAMTLCQSERWSVEQKGSIGCFLSHVMCWEKLEADGISHAIILEDDAIFPQLDLIYSLELPSEYDFIFLNERMSLPVLDAPPTCYPSIRGVIGHSHQDLFWGAGTDGYLISAAGVKKLLKAVERDLFYGIIDGRLIRYCTSEEDAMEIPKDSRIRLAILEHHHGVRVPLIGILRAFVVSPALVSAGGFKSVRE